MLCRTTKVVIVPLVLRPSVGIHVAITTPRRNLASRSEDASGADELTAAREWLARLDHSGVEGFLKSNSQMTFSTSSGAGGQNVNR